MTIDVATLGVAPYIQGLALLVATGLLARLVWWDVKEFLLPDVLVAAYGGLGLLLVLVAPLPGQTPMNALAGAFLGGCAFWVIRALMSTSLGREAMGLGDVKLAVAVGLWIGWDAIPLFMLLGSGLAGLAYGGIALVRRRRGLDSVGFLPFGPSLVIAAAVLTAAMVGGYPLGAVGLLETIMR